MYIYIYIYIYILINVKLFSRAQTSPSHTSYLKPIQNQQKRSEWVLLYHFEHICLGTKISYLGNEYFESHMGDL